jgi:flagellar basal body-associated protein FliL
MADTQPKWDATRVFIVVIVVIFLVSSLAVSIAVIMELAKGNDKSTKSATTNTTSQQESKEGKLQGTKLADFTPVESADQAYGANPPQGSGIPANAPLVFDIELVKIGQ